LPATIAIQRILPVIPSAHARFSPIYREYKYYLLTGKDPFLETRAWYTCEKLDVDAMDKAAKYLMQFTDFECFSKRNTNVKTYNCKVLDAGWTKEGDLLIFTIRADRFLRNMVRAIVGTLIDIGRHKTDIDGLKQIIESKNRSRAGYSVPAKGLFLTDVVYPDLIFSEKPVSFLKGSLDEIETHDEADAKFHDGAGNESDE
jgi:tRNA pseudouridine38-40 synthase